MTACDKAEIPAPAPESHPDLQLKKTAGGGGAGNASTVTTAYVGRATAIDATVWNFQSVAVTSKQTTLADTYFLPTTGGAASSSELQGSIPGTLTSGALTATTTGQNNSTVSTSSVISLNITVGGNTITADYLAATANSACGAVPSGTVQITNLVLNGQAIAVTGVASQALYLPNGGMIILNERSGAKKGNSYTMTITAMHIILPNVADIKVAAARAEVKC